MSEQKSTWLQRLVGTDSAPTAALEEQLVRAKDEVQRLSAELARERDKVAEREQQLGELQEQARRAEQDFEARLVSVRQSTEERLAAQCELELQHKNATGELAITRNQLTRQRDESGKLNKSLAAANAQVARAESAAQTARAHATEAETKLAAAEKDSQQARERVAQLERAAETSTKELSEAKRRLQTLEARAAAVETRASTVEHELAETKQAQQRAEAEAQRLAPLLLAAQAEKDHAQRMASDACRALERALGDAALLAFGLGVEPGAVEGGQPLASALGELKRALEEGTPYRVSKLETAEGAVVVELDGVALPGVSKSAPWPVAYSVSYLEKATGMELAVESSALSSGSLSYRLRPAAPTS